MDLIILFRTLLRKIWILILIPLLSGILVYLLTSHIKKEYLSRAQLATGFTVKDLTNQDFNIMTSDVKFDNLIENMLSPQVVSQTGHQLLIHDLSGPKSYSENVEIKDSIKTLISKIGRSEIINVLQSKIKTQTILNSNDPLERAIYKILEAYGYDDESLKDVISVQRSGRSDYVNVYAKTIDPLESAFIVNSLCRDFLKFNNSTRDTRNIGSLDTLKQLVEEKRKYLSEKQKELTDFKTMIGILDLNTSGSSKVDLISSFEQTLSKERSDLVESESEFREINNRLRAIAGGTQSQSISTDLLALRTQINDLDDAYQRTKDPSILVRLKELTKKRDDLAGTYDIDNLKDDKKKKSDLEDRASELRAKINSSRQNIRSLQNRIAALNSNVSSYAGKEAEMNALEQEVDLAQTDYATINARYNDATSLNTSFNASGITQSLVGQPAIKPERSKRLLIVIADIVATFVVCVVVIVIALYFDSSVKTPSNFIKATKIKVIGSIPLLSLDKKSKKFFFEEDLKGMNPANNKKLNNLLNKLRYEIESSNCKLVLFTSTNDQTGKTTVLSLLSGFYSKSKKRILIIDSNFSHNEITQNLEVDPDLKTNGSKLMIDEGARSSDQGKEDLAVSNVRDIMPAQNTKVVHTPYDNVDVMGCRQDYYLQTEKFPLNEPFNKFKNLVEDYDYIFIEGPCLNTYPDSKELAKYVDGVVLVSSLQDPIKHIDKESLNFLKGLGPEFLGAILNKVDIRDIS